MEQKDQEVTLKHIHQNIQRNCFSLTEMVSTIIYLKEISNARLSAPGAAYYRKTEKFMEVHCEIGAKYMEHLKFSCVTKLGNACQFCLENSWLGPECSRVPRPIPDYEKLPLHKYKHVTQTESSRDGLSRKVDDFQPRVQLKAAVEGNELSLSNELQVNSFCETFIVEKDMVVKCLDEMEVKELKKKKKKSRREKKSFH